LYICIDKLLNIWKIKRIDIKEFREKGYLQELNRRFSHPLGGIWDYCGDKEGIYYDISNAELERKTRFIDKKLFIDIEFENRCKNRKEILGFDIEPLN
jgi:hypothetical protein